MFIIERGKKKRGIVSCEREDKEEKEKAEGRTDCWRQVDVYKRQVLKVQGEKKPLRAKFYGTKTEKIVIRSAEEEQKIEKELENADFHVAEVRKGERTQKSPLPFTTSTLQQEASKVLNFATQKTMRIAPVSYTHLDVYKRQLWRDA